MMVNGAAQSWQATTQFNLPQSTAGAKTNGKPNVFGGRQDSISFSQAGRQQQQLLGSLAEKKDTVVKQKNALIAQTLEDGLELNAIQDQLDGFEEQLEIIDEQISTILMGQTADAIDSLEAENETEKSDPFGNEIPQDEDDLPDAVSEAAGFLADVSSKMELSQKAASVSRQFESRANILKRELKSDAQRNRIENPKPGDNAASREYAAGKSGKMVDARRKANLAYGQAAKLAGKATEKMVSNKETPLTKMASQAAEPTNEQEAQDQTDISVFGGLDTIA